MKATIYTNSPVIKALFKQELFGQFSDGLWENSRNESWRYLDEVKLSYENKTVFDKYIPSNYKAYNCNRQELKEYVGTRMLAIARIAYSMREATTYVYSLAEAIVGCSKLPSTKKANWNYTMEDINEEINKYKNSKYEYSKILYNEWKKLDHEKILSALNSEDYSTTDLRNDLKKCTSILKNVKAK